MAAEEQVEHDGSAHATRLESLFHLIKEGSCIDIRENAAEQLGHLAVQSITCCRSICQRVHALLLDDEWDVRVASTKCLDVLAASLCPSTIIKEDIESPYFALRCAQISVGRMHEDAHQHIDFLLSVRSVSIDRVVQEGAPLLRSGGEEYQYETNLNDEERKRYAIKQRRVLLRRICGANDTIWNTREDAFTQQMLPRLNLEHVKALADDIEQTVGKQDSVLMEPTTDPRKRAIELLGTSANKKLKSQETETEQTTVDILACLVADLFESIFDARWEIRHGALMALRQVFVSSKLIVSLLQKSSRSHIIEQWLEECLVRCICVLALDQFVDYSADGSVSPVREVCAQVFGILLGNFEDQQLLVEYIDVVRRLFHGSTWHARHGGLLGLKYLILAHQKHALDFVPLVFDDMMNALVEGTAVEDEVLVTAASMAQDMTSFLDQVDVPKIQVVAKHLWRVIATHSTSVGIVPASAIAALSAWYQHDRIRQQLSTSTQLDVVENLLSTIPLLHQYTQTVRLATAACLEALFASKQALNTNQSIMKCLLPHLLLQLLRETHEITRKTLSQAWQHVISYLVCVKSLESSASIEWFELLWSIEKLEVLNARLPTDSHTSTWADSSVMTTVRDNLAARIAFSEALGFLAASLDPSSAITMRVIELVTSAMVSLSGELQCGSLLVLSYWAKHAATDGLEHLRKAIGPKLQALAESNWMIEPNDGEKDANLAYSEQLGSLKRMRIMQTRIFEVFASARITIQSEKLAASTNSTSIAQVARAIAEQIASLPFNDLQRYPKQYEIAHFKRQDLFLIDEMIQKVSQRLYHRVQGFGSAAYCNLLPIPPKKSGFLVKALMDSIKQEESLDYQHLSACTLAVFIQSEARRQRKCIAKIISNLCNSATALVTLQNDKEPTTLSGLSAEALQQVQIRVRGAEHALRTICKPLGPQLLDLCPTLCDIVAKAWTASDENVVLQSMHLLEVVIPAFDPACMTRALPWVRQLATLVQRDQVNDRSRQAVAQVLGLFCRYAPSDHALLILYQQVFNAFDSHANASLLGATMVLGALVTQLGGKIAPFVPSLVHYAMKSMCVPHESVRTTAAAAFAALMSIVSIQTDFSISNDQSELYEIVRRNQVSRQFLSSLLQGNAVNRLEMTPLLSPKIILREYQQHGIDWLSFLVQNNLHGILADDMGLGKTLQALSVIAHAHDSKKQEKPPVVSLIVCPPVVVDHWIREARKCFRSGIFDEVIDYSGTAAERKQLQLPQRIHSKSSLLVLTTYAVVRSEIDWLSSLSFSFVVLDEAHLIRNPKTALFEAIRRLAASHRLVLTGTPLQNHVGDLWSLFEFLMPGYLGDFSEFKRSFVLPITKSKERNATSKQKEAAALQLTQLHQRVLPFVLRRTKQQVLKELPPKIISNVMVSLSAIQRKLYNAATVSTDKEETKSASNVLTNLQLLRRICVHPALVHHHPSLMNQLTANEKKSMQTWQCSGKLVALHDVLVDSCNYGRDADGEASISTHRCLIFSQLKETLDWIQVMLHEALPRITYRRLDGQTPLKQRSAIISSFNGDPTIDVLLLTTSVGGLGLTLTGADTVIFVEHAWNPFVDLQAMDRAHRIGQKRTVRVFRLLMKQSLEEHIINLQVFKEHVASTVVTTQDASQSMNANTTQVLNLLQQSSERIKDHLIQQQVENENQEEWMALLAPAQQLLNQLGELWDETQYDALAFPSTTE